MLVNVHIGTHKTGTTSIQAALREHAGSLSDGGIYVPTAGTHSERSGHHNIGWALRKDPRYRPENGSLGDLLAELARAEHAAAVISSEDLGYLVDQPGNLSDFERQFREAGHRLRYIVFVRRPDHYAQSLYAELLGHGLRATYSQFVRTVLREGKYTLNGDWVVYLDAARFIRRWRAIAASPLVVVDYDAASEEGAVASFLRVIDAPDSVVAEASGGPKLNTRKQADILPLSGLVSGLLLSSRYGPRKYRALVS